MMTGASCCRGSLLPDPRYDAVQAIVLAVMDDVEECPDGLYTARLMLFDDSGKPPKDAMSHVQVSIIIYTLQCNHIHKAYRPIAIRIWTTHPCSGCQCCLDLCC